MTSDPDPPGDVPSADRREPAAIAHTLDSAGVEYEVMSCDPEHADTYVFCERYGIPLEHSANTILIKGKTGEAQFAACVVLADSKLDVSKEVRKRLGARRVSFASADETRAVTGMELGGVTPIGLPPGLPLWVDARVMRQPYVVLGGGDRSSKIKVDPAVFDRIPGVLVIEGLARQRD